MEHIMRKRFGELMAEMKAAKTAQSEAAKQSAEQPTIENVTEQSVEPVAIPAPASNTMIVTPGHKVEVHQPIKPMTFAEKMAQKKKAAAASLLPKVVVADTPAEEAIIKTIELTSPATAPNICQEYSFREILDMLTNRPDIMFTVPNEQVQELRSGLAARKAKDQQKLTKINVKADSLTLQYLVYPATDDAGQPIEGHSIVRIKLAPRKGINILSIKFPDDASF